MNVNLKGIATNLANSIKDNAPIVYTIVEIMGVVTTGYLSARAAVASFIDIRDKEKEIGREMTSTEKVKLCWKNFIPPVISGAVTSGASIMSKQHLLKGQAGLATICGATVEGAREYQDKIVNLIGDEKEKEVHKELEKNQVVNFMRNTDFRAINMNDGKEQFIDGFSKRPFRSTVVDIRKIENHINSTMLRRNGPFDEDSQLTLNDYYREYENPVELGDLPAGQRLGFDRSHLLEIDISGHDIEGFGTIYYVNYQVYNLDNMKPMNSFLA